MYSGKKTNSTVSILQEEGLCHFVVVFALYGTLFTTITLCEVIVEVILSFTNKFYRMTVFTLQLPPPFPRDSLLQRLATQAFAFFFKFLPSVATPFFYTLSLPAMTLRMDISNDLKL